MRQKLSSRRTVVLLFGCLAGIVGGAPAVALPITLDRGYLTAAGSPWVGPGTQVEMLLGGERGFTYFGVSYNLNFGELRAPKTGSYQLTFHATADRPGGLVGANVNDRLAATANVEARDFGDYGEPYVMVFPAQAGDLIRVWMYSPATPGYVVIDDVSLTVEDARRE